MTARQVQGLSFSIEPLPFATTGDNVSRTVRNVSSYNHETRSIGGYWSASFGVDSLYDDLEQWVDGTVGRAVYVRNPGGVVIWEGIINQVRIVYGPFELAIGPYLDVINSLEVNFQTVTFNTNPPVGGNKYILPAVTSASSQGVYGVLEGVISAGEGAPEDMIQAQAIMLDEFSKVKISQRLSLSGESASSFSVQVDCVGFVRLLEKYFYYDASLTDSNLSDKIIEVLQADPNGIYTNFGNIDENTSQIQSQEEGTRTAYNVIRDIVTFGGSGNTRYVFAVSRDRTPYYYAVDDSSVDYVLRLSNPGQFVFGATGNNRIIDPWDIEAAKVVQVTDFVPGVRLDSTRLFIESVQYTYPFGLSLTGGKFSQAEQLLARAGLKGFF